MNGKSKEALQTHGPWMSALIVLGAIGAGLLGMSRIKASTKGQLGIDTLEATVADNCQSIASLDDVVKQHDSDIRLHNEKIVTFKDTLNDLKQSQHEIQAEQTSMRREMNKNFQDLLLEMRRYDAPGQ